VLENYPEGETEYVTLPNNPTDENAGTREVPFSREIFIEREDVSLNPPPKFHRLKPDGEVRLMGAYVIKFKEAVLKDDGEIDYVVCTCDMATAGGNCDRKIKGTIHWLSAPHAVKFSALLYNDLFTIENLNDMPEDKTYDDFLNPESVVKMENAYGEPSLKDATCAERFQFVRNGYFVKDIKHEGTFNRIVPLKDGYRA